MSQIDLDPRLRIMVAKYTGRRRLARSVTSTCCIVIVRIHGSHRMSPDGLLPIGAQPSLTSLDCELLVALLLGAQ